MKASRNQKIEVIVEAHDGMLWGVVEKKGNFVASPYGETKDEVIANLKELITDYQQNEGKKDKFWNKIDVDNMQVEISYDLQAFFEEFSELKISSIAKRAELNPSLLRQYATGNKYPSADQARKIETALHTLGKKLEQVSICA